MRCWSCSTFVTSLMLNLSLFVALAITVAHADYKTKPTSMRGDAPYSHRRLFGIRRLKVIRPLIAPSDEVERVTELRRHQSTDENTSNYISYVPRAQPPPKIPDVFEYPVTRLHTKEKQSIVTTTMLSTTENSVHHDEDLYEEKRKRIEARWRRLGINIDAVQLPIRKMIREKLLDFSKSPIKPKARPVYKSGQSVEAERQTSEFLPKRDNIQIEPTKNTRKSVPMVVEDKDVQQTTTKRPRIHGPILGVLPISEDGDRAIHSALSSEAPVTTPLLTTTEATTTRPYTTTESTTTEAEIEDSGAGFGFGPSELPPEFANVGFGIGGNGINFNVANTATEPPPSSEERRKRPKQRKQPNPEILKESERLVIPQNSGLRPVSPPKEFLDGRGFGPGARGDHEVFPQEPVPSSRSASPDSGNDPDSGLFTGDSALTPSNGPTGDGYGPPIYPGGAVPPLVPAVGLGGAAAGKSPYGAVMEATENPPTTVKPSALLNVLNKADQGFNQAITHFEQESPLETAAIDILEVALGSTKLDSQAKLLGHVDRTIGLDNLQRIQRWANTAGAMDVFKEQVVKFIKNIEPAEDLLPTLPPQLEYIFKTSGR